MTTPDAPSGDRTWCDRGGYVQGFEEIFDPTGFGLDAREVSSLDPLFQWTLHVAREALRDAQVDPSRQRTGVMLGNLSFPSQSLARYAEHVWFASTPVAPRTPAPAASNRFQSGMPALMLGPALGLTGPALCLDAACASSLYALSLACDALHDGEVDVMLAGAVNCADDLFIHVGFCALSAMSRSGRSRPFHAEADGLVPAEGCAMLVLQRLDDALAQGRRIHGVIRGVGLTNDGRARGLLAPSERGQVRAMRAAWERARLSPERASYVECHATGTPIGDNTEIQSLRAVFGDRSLPIGSLKANMGHLVTVAGVAGVMKVLAGFDADTIPPTPHIDTPTEALRGTRFRVVTEPEPWPRGDTPRVAAVSAFGFGGNNAHLVLEDWRGQPFDPGFPSVSRARVAVVSVGVRAGDGASTEAFAGDVLLGRSRVRARGDGTLSAHADTVELPLGGLRFPPTDLERAVAQQTLLLSAAWDAMDAAGELPRDRTGVLVGMQCDPEVARWGARWRLVEEADRLAADDTWTAAARDAVAPALDAATVLGTMPNIPANRIHSQFDLGGAGCTVSAEEHSGLAALLLAMRALRYGALDACLVGAVDLCAEPVHERAARECHGRTEPAGDAAVALLLMREDDARATGRSVLAVFDDDAPPALSLGDGALELTALFGRAHAASGLVHTAAGVLALHHGARPSLTLRERPDPWEGKRTVRITSRAAGTTLAVTLVSDAPPAPFFDVPTKPRDPSLRLRARRPFPVIPPLPERPALPSTMALAPFLPPVFDLPSPDEPVSMTLPSSSSNGVLDAATASHGAFVAATPTHDLLAGVVGFQRMVGEAHRAWLAQQTQVHRRFLDFRARTLNLLLTTAPPMASRDVPTVPVSLPASQSTEAPKVLGAASHLAPSQRFSEPSTTPPPTVLGSLTSPEKTPTNAQSEPFIPATQKHTARPVAARPRGIEPNRRPPAPRGLTLTRQQLEVHAGGRISEVFGPLFQRQDDYQVQVRMPMAPMLLADRVTGLDAVPGVLGRGTVWTETDIRWDAWYLHDGRMPAGVMIETGQADLLLVSYMGIDFLNRGERRYRLLGCELTYHRSPPAAGETVDYDIHIDGHANQGDVRLMFFHYDCRIAGEPALSVRNGQAGFFTRKELDESAGILWQPETQEIVKLAEEGGEGRLDEPPVRCTRRSFTKEQIHAFAHGDAFACFGPGFERALTHNRSPRIAAGRLTFLDRVTELSPRGGPWRRGYLRAETDVHPDDWFFPGHFLNDPCMPGTLMFEACLQAMAFYLTAMGVTLPRDGWRFEPVTGETYKLLCRGQVIPESKLLVYEVFVEEFVAAPVPTLFADLLCTVDGLKAFHARRVGLRLVPDWPLTSRQRPFAFDAPVPPPGHEPLSLPQCDASKPVAVVANGPSAGFRLDYASLLACAWGRPSAAFGAIYERFDGARRVARLPGPPYHFMSRIVEVQGAMGEAKAGARVVVDYDVPPDAWYFARNGARTMPLCVLMEAALQPCGWLASYVGCTLLREEDLLFRNLDGKGTLLGEVFPDAGTLRTTAKLTSVSLAGAMIIVGFEVRCAVRDETVYTLDTVFGFFPPSAFEDQAGLPTAPEQRALFELPSRNVIDCAARPDRLRKGTARLADPYLLMIDRVTHLDLRGGRYGLGVLRAEKDVNPAEWFFKAHFFQDPVQPGSLGIEAMCQLLQAYMLEAGMHEGMRAPRFEPIASGHTLTWKYRGQVVPENKTIACTLEVRATGQDERGVFAVADASLWVDGKRIYDARDLAMRLIDDGDDTEEALDPSKDTWLNDHAPTWVLPALPAMSVLDRLAGAVRRASGREVIALDDFQIDRWILLAGPTRLRTVTSPRADGRFDATLEVYREARDPRLSRFEPVARAVVTLGSYPDPPPALAPLEAPEVPDPYATGTLFHGPAFQLLRLLRRDQRGSSARVAARSTVPFGTLNQGLLDAMTHGIPHDTMETWSEALPRDRAAYPHRVEAFRLYGPPPHEGHVRVEARFLSWDGTHVRTRLQGVVDGRVWCEFTLAEVLMPKGPIGVMAPQQRVAFLRDRRYVEGGSLSRFDGEATVLDPRDVSASNWLPGTVERVYGLHPGDDVAVTIAVKDHVARATATHPSRVRVEGTDALSAHEPFTRRVVSVAHEGARVTVRDGAPPSLDVGPVRDFWRQRLQTGLWPGEDLYFSLIERFVRRVWVEDPDAFEALRGKPVLYLANHQVGVESIFFGIMVSALNGLSTLTLAKAEHRESWVGQLLKLGFAYPGIASPRVITYFDRDDPASLPDVLRELGAAMKESGTNVMIHVEGTRSLSCRQPVVKMTGAILEMAIAMGVHVAPVRFVGALPVDPLPARIEFPVGMGRQDIYVGAPIAPETLAAMPYKPRKDHMIAAINGLGPDNAVEVPFPGDPVFEASVASWVAQTGVDTTHATIFRALEAYGPRTAVLQALVAAARTGRLQVPEGPEGVWLAELARRLYGPRGPAVLSPPSR
jgi:3-oxoacyl-(acyl-carrier-protein) synthase/3-hydroxymyristoyl/3-hydroxydecanoyl-(acyl carrier protein) dehydratase/1-acyl-sn-glycerol-3-phosphate acyltransferase